MACAAARQELRKKAAFLFKKDLTIPRYHAILYFVHSRAAACIRRRHRVLQESIMKKLIIIIAVLFIASRYFGLDIKKTASTAYTSVKTTAYRVADAIHPGAAQDFEDIDSQLSAAIVKSGAVDTINTQAQKALFHTRTFLNRTGRQVNRLYRIYLAPYVGPYLNKLISSTKQTSVTAGSSARASAANTAAAAAPCTVDLSTMELAQASQLRKNFINYSMSLHGIPYVWGGETPKQGMDCSGFVKYASMHGIGVALPRTAQEMCRSTASIADSEREPGDLVFFKSGSKVDHVGIYLGKYQGKGPLHGRELFINSANKGPRTGVVISAMDEPYWRRHFYASRRFLPSAAEIAQAQAQAESL